MEHEQDLLAALGQMPGTDPEYGQWWAGETGQWLYSQIGERVGAPLARRVNTTYGTGQDSLDVTNTAVVVLRRQAVHDYIRAAADPWAYLAGVVKREVTACAGTFFRARLAPSAEASAPALPPVRMREAVEATIATIAPYCDLERGTLSEAVWYFAENGHTRLSHLFTDATKDPELTGLGLCREQILAIANVVLGARPGHEASLLGAFLLDADFAPATSLPHVAALRKFSRRIARPTVLLRSA